MRLTFLGAAGEVTGSQHLVEAGELRLLLDCGLFQGHRDEADRKNRSFDCDPKSLDGVVLSHAHIDHCGNLPGLYRAGFRGPIFCSAATADVAEIMLRDSARIQEEDAKYLARKLKGKHPRLDPLYTEEDVEAVVRRFEPLDFDEWHELSPVLSVRLAHAGHILGSAIVELLVDEPGGRKRVVFSGDLGRRGMPLLKDPALVPGCDVLICESTYGGRVHPPPGDLKQALLRIVTETFNNGGRVVIPAFSLGRTQQIVYFLNELHLAGSLPDVPVFVDSPLANRLVSVYRRHQEQLDTDAQRLMRLDDDLFGFDQLQNVYSRQDSQALNHRKDPFVVIAASGMCEHGRIRHHLKHVVSDPHSTILIVGFQAPHTLGRRLVERQPKVKIFDRLYDLRAKVEIVNGLSAHADAPDFKWWFEGMASEGGIGRAFLVHGEADAAASLATVLADYCDEEVTIPAHGESFEV